MSDVNKQISESTKCIDWINKHFEELEAMDQLEFLKCFLVFRKQAKLLYEKYNASEEDMKSLRWLMEGEWNE